MASNSAVDEVVYTIQALRKIIDVDPIETGQHPGGIENSTTVAQQTTSRSPLSALQTDSSPSSEGDSILNNDGKDEEEVDKCQFIQDQILSPDLLLGGEGEFEGEGASPVSLGTSEASTYGKQQGS